MPTVPNVNARKRIPMSAIRTVVARIAELVHPQKIILFGSYASGDPKPWSDVDLLIVMESALTPNKQRLAIARALQPRPFAMDLLIYSPRELAERIPLGDWFLKEVVEKGVTLYERADSGVDRESRSRPDGDAPYPADPK